MSTDGKEVAADNLGLLSDSSGLLSKVIVDNHYSYNALGNMEKKETIAGLTSYGYDKVDRLNTVTKDDVITEYRYDNAGNRIEKLERRNAVEKKSEKEKK